VEREEFERAAEIRDRIKTMEREVRLTGAGDGGS
jgi:protein-arginine kinase activator protein McsA